MTEGPRVVSKADGTALLRRLGVDPDRIAEMMAQLPDPFDLDKEEPVFARYGITQGRLMESMGGSP